MGDDLRVVGGAFEAEKTESGTPMTRGPCMRVALHRYRGAPLVAQLLRCAPRSRRRLRCKEHRSLGKSRCLVPGRLTRG